MRVSTTAAALAAAYLLVALPSAAREAYRKNLLEGVTSETAGPELFMRAYEVFSHPRCSNCHPRDDQPWWDIEIGRVHGMNVRRGREDKHGAYGLPGMECVTCHQEQNGKSPGSPPGATNWRLAPKSMGWGGKSAGEVCASITDPARNGGRKTPDEVVGHMVGEKPDPATGTKGTTPDPLVRWAWDPGPGREAAPGTFDDFVLIMQKWAESGAKCKD